MSDHKFPQRPRSSHTETSPIKRRLNYDILIMAIVLPLQKKNDRNFLIFNSDEVNLMLMLFYLLFQAEERQPSPGAERLHDGE